MCLLLNYHYSYMKISHEYILRMFLHVFVTELPLYQICKKISLIICNVEHVNVNSFLPVFFFNETVLKYIKRGYTSLSNTHWCPKIILSIFFQHEFLEGMLQLNQKNLSIYQYLKIYILSDKNNAKLDRKLPLANSNFSKLYVFYLHSGFMTPKRASFFVHSV